MIWKFTGEKFFFDRRRKGIAEQMVLEQCLSKCGLCCFLHGGSLIMKITSAESTGCLVI